MIKQCVFVLLFVEFIVLTSYDCIMTVTAQMPQLLMCDRAIFMQIYWRIQGSYKWVNAINKCGVSKIYLKELVVNIDLNYKSVIVKVNYHHHQRIHDLDSYDELWLLICM